MLLKIENAAAATGNYTVNLRVWPDERAISLGQFQFHGLYAGTWPGASAPKTSLEASD